MMAEGPAKKKRSSRYEDWFVKDDFTRHELALLMAGLAPDWPFSRDILDVHVGDLTHYEFEDKYAGVGGHMEFVDRFKQADELVFRALHVGSLRDVVANEGGPIPRIAAIRFVLECEIQLAEDDRSEGDGRHYKVFVEAAKSAPQAIDVMKMRPIQRKGAVQDSTSANWKMLVQEEAARRWKQFTASGATPTMNNLKEDLAKWCAKQGLTGAHGKLLSAEYIRRHVLTGWRPPT